MRYLFDSSAIFIAYKRGLEYKLQGHYTIDLALFELGNLVWKECHVFKSISVEEAVLLLEALIEIISLMNIIPLSKLDKEIAKIAFQLKINFYEACYVYASKNESLILVTEDEQFKKSVNNYVKTKSLDEI